MVPAPNLIAGLIIGIANDSWISLLLSSLGWVAVFCVYVSVGDRARAAETIAQFRDRGQRLFLGSPTATFYVGEAITAALTAAPIASIVYATKSLFA